MYQQEILLNIEPHLRARLEKEGFTLVDLRFYRSQAKESILEVLADRAEGGITLDECSRLNRELGVFLDTLGFLTGSYTLDVSSPGLDRPLFTRADFKRSLGREVRVFLKEAVAEKIEHQGALENAGENSIFLKTKDKTIEIPFEKINKTKQVIL
jgi:ribosome maturation factor RimP